MSNKARQLKSPEQDYKTTKYIHRGKLDKGYKETLKEADCLTFSFKHLDLNDPEFKIDRCEGKWFIKLLERKKSYCTMTPQKIKEGGKATRCHTIDWSQTSKRGFNIPNLSYDIDERQLGISKNRGRIIGFFVENLFYVVWLDPDHNLYA